MNKRRSPLRPISDHPQHLKVLISLMGLIFLSGFMVLVLNVAVFSDSSISLEMGADVLNRLVMQSALTLGITMFFSGMVIVIYMKQVVGPMHRLEKWLVEALKGDFSRSISFRKGDQFESIGLLLEELREKVLKK